MIGKCIYCACALVMVFVGAPLSQAHPARPNVLFIAIDDLNDWVGHLGGHPQAKTPHIDRLASRGVSFANAHCAAPACNPSRAALLSGVRPSTSGVYLNGIDWRKHLQDVDMLPVFFRKHGYKALGAGKIYHGRWRRNSDWDVYAPGGHRDLPPKKGHNRGVGGIRFAPVEGGDEDMFDFKTVDWTIEQLQKKHDKPFFLCCGIHKPHMAWNVPQKYYDLHPLAEVTLPKVLDSDLDDVPAAGVRMARPKGDHRQMLRSGRWKEAVQGYLAACSFADAMVGRLLDAFDKCDYKDNTIIVLWGDHGWHLGEKQHWRKFALWEEATKAPLIVVAPGVTKPGGVCRRSVDFMSIYPTLAELCKLPIPKHVEGPSIRSLLADPNAAWNQPAITTHGFGNHAVRTEKWRYIRYNKGDEELYDQSVDPLQWKNLAGDGDYAETKNKLAALLPKKNVKQPGGDLRRRRQR